MQDWLDNPGGNFSWVLKDRVEGELERGRHLLPQKTPSRTPRRPW
ncbi:MAG: hypothetical protein R3E96_08760 [Planctomycetota bacterium]